jgi:hypothetical protein
MLSFHRQEGISLLRFPGALLGSKRLRHAPEAEVEPRSRVGEPDRPETVEVTDGALEPNRWCVHDADRRELAVGAVQREHGNLG